MHNSKIHLWRLGVLALASASLTGLTSAPALADDGQTAATLFADSQLAGCVEATLRVSPGEPLTRAKLATLTELGCARQGIESLDGIGNLPNLSMLSVEHNPIHDATPVRGLSALKFLNMSQTEISDLSPIFELDKLTWAAMSEVPASSVEGIENLSELEHLRLSNTRVKDFSPIGDLTLLTELRIDGNELTDIDFLRGLNQLASVDFSNNRVTDLSPIGALPALRTAPGNENAIADVSSLATLPDSAYVELNHQQISLPSVAPAAEVSVPDPIKFVPLSPLAGTDPNPYTTISDGGSLIAGELRWSSLPSGQTTLGASFAHILQSESLAYVRHSGEILLPLAEQELPPSAPTAIVATGADSAVQVTWTAPENTGTGAIESYLVEYRNAQQAWQQFGTVSIEEAEITSLTNGEPVEVRVTARNTSGHSGPAGEIARATPYRFAPEFTVEKTGSSISEGSSVAAGATVQLSQRSLPEGASVVLELHSDPISIGTGKVNAEGTLAVSGKLPETLTGAHTLVATLTVEGVESTARVAVTLSSPVTTKPGAESPETESPGAGGTSAPSNRSTAATDHILVNTGGPMFMGLAAVALLTLCAGSVFTARGRNSHKKKLTS